MPAAGAMGAAVGQKRRQKRSEKEMAAATERASSMQTLKGPASQLSEAQYMELRAAFDGFDVDCSGVLDVDEMRDALKLTGLASTDEEIEGLILQIDSNHDGTIDWDEFLAFSAAQLTDPNANNVESELELAFECVLAHCISDDRALAGRLMPAPWRSKDLIDQSVLDLNFVVGLLMSSGQQPFSEEDARDFIEENDPEQTGLVRYGAFKKLLCWQPAPLEEGQQPPSRLKAQPRSPPSRGMPMSAAGSSYALGVGASQLGASRMGGQQATLYAAGGLELASSGVHLPDASLELDAPPRELIAHAALEAAQTKLEVMQALAQAKMELVEAKLHAVHSHVPPGEDTGGWWTFPWSQPNAGGEDLSA